MATNVLTEKPLHTPVSNANKAGSEKKSLTTAKKAEMEKGRGKTSFNTYPEKASIVSNLDGRERFVTRVKSFADSTRLEDAAFASFGNARLLEVVIADDDREAVVNVLENPWRKIAALRIKAGNQKTYAGTGWFIAPRVLVTAGHCVYMHDEGGWPQEIEVIPALDGTRKPYESVVSKTFSSNEGWVNDRNSDYDYGIIVLDKPINAQIGWFSFAAAPDEYLNSNIANISGYPVDRDSATKQYYHARQITRASSRRIYYEIDTYGGQSGSPVWMNLGEGKRVAIGIHTTGSSNSNFGTRITKEVFENLQTWKNQYNHEYQ